MLTMTAAEAKTRFGPFFPDRLTRNVDAVVRRVQAKSDLSCLDPIGELRILSPRASLDEPSSGG